MECEMATTIPQLFLQQVTEKPGDTAIHIKRDGSFQPLTWNELHGDVRRFAAHLLRLGVNQGDRVVQFSENRYEWILMDLAIHLLGAVHVPVHSTLSGAQVIEQAVDSGSQLMVVSTDELRHKLETSTTPLPSNIALRAYDSVGDFRGQPVSCFDEADTNIKQLVEQVIELEQTIDDRINEES